MPFAELLRQTRLLHSKVETLGLNRNALTVMIEETACNQPTREKTNIISNTKEALGKKGSLGILAFRSVS